MAMIDCPFCDGRIRKGVLKCKHCGEYISDIKSPHVPKRLWVGGDLTIGRGCMKIQFAA